jgi:putative aldouronate transport system permease protein
MATGKKIGEQAFNVVLILIMIFVMLLTFYPFYYAVINSFNEGQNLARGYALIWPSKVSFESWRTILSDDSVIKAFMITASRTVIVTVSSIFITAMFAYAFSRPYLQFKKPYLVVGLVTMYFSGGIIPYFLLISKLNLYDNYLVYIIPSLFGGFWNVIIFNSNFKALPDSLFESAKLDGANDFRIFFQIVLPLSKPVLAALSVFTAVGVWNDYGTTLFYTRSSDLQTLQYYILSLVKSYNALQQMQSSAMAASAEVANLLTGANGVGPVTAKTLELSAMVLAALPMIIIYPFAQKFFAKGVLIGAVKG